MSSGLWARADPLKVLTCLGSDSPPYADNLCPSELGFVPEELAQEALQGPQEPVREQREQTLPVAERPLVPP